MNIEKVMQIIYDFLEQEYDTVLDENIGLWTGIKLSREESDNNLKRHIKKFVEKYEENN